VHFHASLSHSYARYPHIGSRPAHAVGANVRHHAKFHQNRSNCSGSASPVLTATGFVNGRWQFSTPHRIHTPLPITKKFVASDYIGDPYGCAKFGANPSTGSFWANGWNITKIFYIFLLYLFFMNSPYRSDPLTDFHAWWLRRRGLAQGCAFWGFRWHCFPFWGWNTPKIPILGAWIGVFKPNGQNIESFMLSKLMHRFQPNFAQR